MNNFPLSLSPTLFWDTDSKQLNSHKHARFIIERVLTRGTLTDWRLLVAYYGLEGIQNEVLQMRVLDNITLNFCSTLFNVPKENFRCYKQEPSIQALWNY